MRQAAIVLQVNAPQQCVDSVCCNMKDVHLSVYLWVIALMARLLQKPLSSSNSDSSGLARIQTESRIPEPAGIYNQNPGSGPRLFCSKEVK